MKRIFCSLLFFLSYFFHLTSLEEILNEDPATLDYELGKGEGPQDISKFEVRLSAECEPISTIADCVNIISGDFFQVDRDIEVDGFEPIHFTRYYDSGRKFLSAYGTRFGSHLSLKASSPRKTKGHTHWRAMVSEREGFPLPVKGSEWNYKIDSHVLEKGYTNLGQVDLHNTQAKFSKNKNGKSDYRWEFILGDGTKRIYDEPVESVRMTSNDCFTNTEYVLSKETRPNGTQLQVEHQIVDNCIAPRRLRTFTKSGVQLNEINFGYGKNHVEITSDRGDRTTYVQIVENQKNRIRILDRVKSSQKGSISYRYVKSNGAHKIGRVEREEGRFLDIHYDKNGRVSSLHSPIGCLYRFEYHKDTRSVWNALKQLTLYELDKNRLVAIKECKNEEEIYRQQQFFWKESEGTLSGKVLCKDSNHCRHLTTYRYDKRNNMTKETFYGNLTGKGSNMFSMQNKNLWKLIPEFSKGVESYERSYLYSDDDYNLLLKESTPEGFETQYGYSRHSNRLKSRLISYEGCIQERLFHHYDEHGIMTLTIEDDGSHPNKDVLDRVTSRTLKVIQPVYNAGPSFGKPAEIQELYWDSLTQQAIPLKKVVYKYNSRGLPCEENHYDAQSQYRYSIFTHYDGRDRVIYKNNAQGHTTHSTYDTNDNLIEEEIVGSGKKVVLHYDTMNRLTKKITLHQEGEQFEETYEYDLLNRKIASTDHYGRRSQFEYDRLGRPTKEISPSFRGVTPTLIKKYTIPDYTTSFMGFTYTTKGGIELLDLPTIERDANGHVTKKSYNAYGQTTKITHPDGSEESLEYTLSGWLKRHDYADHTIHYTHDGKGRVLLEQTLDKQGNLLKQQEWNYKGPHLMAKKDGRGITTSYRYDGAGRLIEERIADQITQFTYDALGRLQSKIRLLNQAEKQIESYEYDLLDQMISKTLYDQNGNIGSKESYLYDIQGNCIENTLFQDAHTAATTKHHYHSGAWLLSKTDPLGHTLTITYDHVYQQEGQRLLRTISTDPLGRQLIQIYDPYDHLIRQEHRAPHLIHAIDSSYDAAGNKITETHHTDRDYTIQWSYDFRGNVTRIIEGQKEIQFHYNHLGQLQQKIKPDGTAIQYRYDPLGRMILMNAPNLSYHYSYDLNDNCIESYDAIHQLRQYRTFDAYDQLIAEEISPGNRIECRRDLLNRITLLTLPNQSTISYHYAPLALSSITRNQLDFTHIHFDWSQHRLGYTLPNGQPVDIQVDLLGRPIQLATPFWNQTLDHFDSLGNLLMATFNGKPTHYTYDAQNQLTSENQISYRFDPLYNRLQIDEIHLSYNSLNQIENQPHDPNGNLGPYIYDALDRLVQCNGKQLIYDPFNRLIRIQGNETLDLLYLDKEEIGAMSERKLTQLKVIDPTDNSIYAIENDGISYSTLQQHGHVVALIEGDKLHSRAYNAFSPAEDSLVPWGFSGKREIADLVYFGNRFYKPSLGRWLTPDPLSFEDGPNLYAYLKNNPFTHFDPYGLEGVSWSDSSMEFGNHFCSNFLGSAIDPVGACFNCDNSLTGAAYYGNFAGRAAGVCCSIAFWEYTAARMTASAIGNCAKGVGRPLFQRVMRQTIRRAGDQLMEQRSLELPTQKGIDSFSRMVDPTKDCLKRGVDFIVGSNGIAIPTHRSVLESGFHRAGFTKFETDSKGMGYMLPNGNIVRIMEPSGRAPLRASFTNQNGGPINPFTGKPIQPPKGLETSSKQFVRKYSHIELIP